VRWWAKDKSRNALLGDGWGENVKVILSPGGEIQECDPLFDTAHIPDFRRNYSTRKLPKAKRLTGYETK
jgi:hypothetical protein